ncbi:MAG TPA: hypothetical protein VLT59_08245 [Steroidobacteraceae bacterium]|nr:hypothetical protein [Steroidobacteraceae bacterium]
MSFPLRAVAIPTVLTLTALAGAAAGYWYASSLTSDVPTWTASLPQSPEDGARERQLEQGVVPATRPSLSAPPLDRSASEAVASRLRAEPQALSRSELTALVDDAARLGGAHDRERLLAETLGRLAEVDPRAALARAQALDPASARALVPKVLGAWAADDLESATAAAFLLEPASQRMAGAREILRRRSDLSPAERRRIAQQLAEPESTEWLLLDSAVRPDAGSARGALFEAAGMAGQARRHERLDRIARLVALQSPTAALELAQQLDDPRDRAAFKRGVAGLWAEADPVAAAEWLEAQSARGRWGVVGAVAAPYARADPRSALEWARRLDPDGSVGAWSAVIATVAETDPVTAVEQALAADIGRGPRNATTVAMAFLARKDPLLAATYLERVTAASERSQATAQIALEMARQGDPAQALDWLDRRGDASAARQGRSQIAFSWATSDPEAALRFGDQLPAGERSEWHGAVVNALANVDSANMLELIRTRRGDPEYPTLLATAARSVAGRQPDMAIAIAGELSDIQQRDEVLGMAVPQLAQRTPREAVRLLDRIDDPERRANATQAVAGIWAQRDADGALDWVRSMPSGPQRDRGYATLVPHLSSLREMDAAIDRIQQTDVRRQAVFNGAMMLAQRGEADAARSLVFRHPLDPGMMELLEARLRGDAEGG